MSQQASPKANESNKTFSLMPQSPVVRTLLKRCIEALPHIVDAQAKAELIAAITKFEKCGVCVAWSADDVGEEVGLTAGEKRQALISFIDEYGISDHDWVALEHAAKEVKAQRVAHVRVHYEPEYKGGWFDGDPLSKLVPLELIQNLIGEGLPDAQAVQAALNKSLENQQALLVSYNLEEVCNADGELIPVIEV